MASQQYDVIVVGGGIVGLATAMELTKRHPRIRLAVLEKEPTVASHQTGHNSGVIHSGIYYRPGSQKAQFCVAGVKALTRFCDENGIEYNQIGKVIIARNESELPRLEELLKRGVANQVEGLQMIGPERLKEIEPHTVGIRALHAPKTGIIDYKKVSSVYAIKVQEQGGDLRTSTKVLRIVRSDGSLVLETTQGSFQTKGLINCGGLYADQVARMMGAKFDLRIIPFRGEYYVLRPESHHLVRGLIYPVPDPRFPFLGVHFTRTIHGGVEAGPNAVLALAREGYTKTTIRLGETLGTLAFRGFWAMSFKYWKIGLGEIYRSFSKGVFAHDLQSLVPEVQAKDLASGGSGVRAQAVDSHGRLLDDFSIQQTKEAVHVLNAPSPGATSSIPIGQHIANLATESFGLGS
ncbi:MAG: L-2-hydroxyglutarate oxidase [Chloroflexi bacterium]|nr:L-2-hydroxyglutarate oxidase [Chloroflexota bacterium]